jgi:Ca2+-binding RTX toxin-like protein
MAARAATRWTTAQAGTTAQGDKYISVENAIGSAWNDTLSAHKAGSLLNGAGGNDTLLGGQGADNLVGGIGSDHLDGSYGADTLNGGDGADTMIGGTGSDLMTGGLGLDTFIFSFGGMAAGDHDRITDFTNGADTIRLQQSAFTSMSLVDTATGSELLLTLAAGGNYALTLDGISAANALDQIVYF